MILVALAATQLSISIAGASDKKKNEMPVAPLPAVVVNAKKIFISFA